MLSRGNKLRVAGGRGDRIVGARLAKLGLISGRRATTHWAFCDHLRVNFPAVTVEPDSLWVKDGKIYSSAGITAGMDLALAAPQDFLAAPAR